MNKVGGRWQRPPWLIKDSLPEEGLFRDDLEDEKSARRQAEGQAFWAVPFTLRLVAETPGTSRWGARWAGGRRCLELPMRFVLSVFRFWSTYSVTHAFVCDWILWILCCIWRTLGWVSKVWVFNLSDAFWGRRSSCRINTISFKNRMLLNTWHRKPSKLRIT